MNKEKLLKAAMLIFNPPLYFIYRRAEKKLDALEKETNQHLDQLGREIDQLGKNVDAHMYEAGDGEPVLPDNPETATPEEIETYRKAVREAGNKSPERE